MADKENSKEVLKQKEVMFRGMSIDDLKKLDVRESVKFIPSRSRRSVLRKFDVIEKFVKRCEDSISRKKKIRTHLRDIVIVPRLVGMQIGIYNGKTFNDVNIVQEMIGHRLGEFSFTRQRVSHGTAGVGATKGSKALKK